MGRPALNLGFPNNNDSEVSDMKTAQYRVGILGRYAPMDGVLYLGEATAPNDWETFVTKGMAMLVTPSLMASWVQVLSSRYPCVVVERVEVAHG